jgi:hypothetical protein
MLNRLPLPDLDPATLALLAAGVVGTAADSLSGRLGFSVAGMSDLLNQIVLDGVILGQGGLQAPEEGIRRTQVTTSTFDASRGGFAGGQVSMTTARGNNRTAGSFSYQFDNDAMQFSTAPTTTGFSRHNIGGSIGGPLIRNKLFYNGSFQLSRNTDHLFALDADDPLAEIRSGVAVDSIGRFLNILNNSYAIPTTGTGAYNRFTDNVRLQGRADWNVFSRQGQSQTLSARFNYTINNQDSTRISVVDLTDHGGESEQNNRLGALTFTSRFGTNWTNGLNFSFSENWSNALPYIELPQGSVRVTSQFSDGTQGTRNLVFGGNPGLPTEAYSRDLQFSDDLSFLLPVGSQLHRLKVGGSVQRTRNINRSTNNIFGTYTYGSLADFEANRPERYSRSLSERRTHSGTLNTGVYFGDTWRISQPLEVTLGLRWDRSELDQQPAYNPVVEQTFGRRTDIEPIATSVSPRIGFNYRFPTQPGVPAKSISGGIGLFAGRAPTDIFAEAVRQTGLPSAEQTLSCIGSAVPIPDWDLYLSDPTAVPTTCADGLPGLPPVLSSRGPTVTLINPEQKMPSSLRVDFGYRTRLPRNVNANFRYTMSRGFGLWGYRDINLNQTPVFLLANDGRPFFGSKESIVSSSGAVSLAGSRVHSAFGNVYDVLANRESSSNQLSVQINGFLPARITMSANYTLGFSRDQGGSGRGFNSATTAGNPNEPEWATASNDRRHTLNLTLSHAISQQLEVTAITQLSSGSPFTPMVSRDINGDGTSNDRAFIYDPGAIADTSIANGMSRMLAHVPGRIANCIESQVGSIAERNSCRNGWTESLSLRASFRPNLPQVGLGRRMTISLDARNVLNGLDQLVNGGDNLHGWGEARNAESRLLEVSGFDPNTNAFKFRVNEAFGQTRRGATTRPFQLTLSGRIAIGGQPFQNNRGFGPPIALGGGPGGDGRGGGPGGFNFGDGGGPGGNAFGDIMAMFRGVQNTASLSTDSLIKVALSNPVKNVIALKDSLKLTDIQLNTLVVLSDTLDAQLARRKETLAKSTTGLNLGQMLPQGGRGGAGGQNGQNGQNGRNGQDGRGQQQQNQNQNRQLDPQTLQRLQLEVVPALDGGRREIVQAMQSTQRALEPAQWEKIPQRLRSIGQPQGGRGGFNAAGLVDRQLTNPIPVLLSLKDTLKLTS